MTTTHAVAEKQLTAADQRNMYIRSTFLLGSFNFERMQAIGFCVSMIPAIKRFYSSKEDQAEALKRHLEFFNTQPWVASPVLGVTAAMECRWTLGTTRKCTGAQGWMSWKANTRSSSYTFFEGIWPAMILQKRQFGSCCMAEG